MRRDDALILDILIAARKIQQFTFQMSKSDFEAHQMAQSAVIREFQVIGEAAKQIAEEIQTRYTNISWQSLTGMRNRMVHEYFRIDFDIVWDTIQQEIPRLITQLESIVPPENP